MIVLRLDEDVLTGSLLGTGHFEGCLSKSDDKVDWLDGDGL
jgi:hypothetical protein